MQFPVINVILTWSQFKAVFKVHVATETLLRGSVSTRIVAHDCKAYKADLLSQLFQCSWFGPC